MKISELTKVLSDALEAQGDIEVFMVIQPIPKGQVIIDPVGTVVSINNELMLVTTEMGEHFKLILQAKKQFSG